MYRHLHLESVQPETSAPSILQLSRKTSLCKETSNSLLLDRNSQFWCQSVTSGQFTPSIVCPRIIRRIYRTFRSPDNLPPSRRSRHTSHPLWLCRNGVYERQCRSGGVGNGMLVRKVELAVELGSVKVELEVFGSRGWNGVVETIDRVWVCLGFGEGTRYVRGERGVVGRV